MKWRSLLKEMVYIYRIDLCDGICDFVVAMQWMGNDFVFFVIDQFYRNMIGVFSFVFIYKLFYIYEMR